MSESTEPTFLESSESISMGGIKNLLKIQQEERGALETKIQKEDEEVENTEEVVDGDQEEEAQEESQEEGTEGEQKASEDDAEDSPSEASFKPKTFVLKQGEAEFAVPNDAVIEVLVDGKTKKLHLQEVINRASGDISVQERITSIENERRKQNDIFLQKEELYARRDNEYKKKDETLKTLAALATEGKPEDLLAFCARTAGKDPVDTLDKFLDDCIQWADNFGGMDDATREHWRKGLKLAVKEQEIQEKEKGFKQVEDEKEGQKAQLAFQTFAREHLTKADVTEDELTDTVQKLAKADVQLESDNDKGKLLEVLDLIHESRVIAAADTTEPSLLKDRDLLQAIFDYTAVRGIRKVSDIKRIVEGFAQDIKKKEVDRIAENLSRKEPKVLPQKTSKANENEERPILTLNDFRRKNHGW